MIKAAVIGSTGYAGQELVRLLVQHPEVKLESITSRSYEKQSFNSVYQNYYNITNMICENDEIEKIAEKVDVIFFALPHGIVSKELNKTIISKTKIIDLGADYRLKKQDTYEKWYQVNHKSPELLKDAVYGLCEWKRDSIKDANLIANPGCYTTCSILSLLPLLKEGIIEEDIIIDAKSGVTGAGRSLNLATHFTECNESIKAYKLASHRHTPEIQQELNIHSNESFNLLFTPHLIPMNRGILTTSYGKLKKEVTYEEIRAIYQKYYKNEFFIRLLPENVYPETRWVKGSNFCDINFKIDENTNRIIVLGAIDNLLKGAAGQAVQNMNILFNLDEKTGLNIIPAFPI